MADSLNGQIAVYREQLAIGDIQKAYRGLLEFIMGLRTHFIHQYPDDFVVGSLYQGYMDITYFPFTPKSLKSQKLKIGIVFNYETFRFEAWLLGQNKQVQKQCWNRFKQQGWAKFPISETPQNSVLKYVLVENPDFDQLEPLTKQIETGVLELIDEVVDFLH